ncbi:MAG: tail fiber protein [Burkholderiales bacterium]|nr:tail fiber protein [Burkholderiales bacterium]
MPGSNQFLALGTGAGANTLTPTAWAALTTLLANGFQSGVANSQQFNTAFRQTTTMAAAIGQFIADQGFNANDDGSVANLKTAFSSAFDVRYAPVTSGIPVGAIMDFGAETPPTGWLECDGSSLSRTGTYAALFAVIGTAHGAVDSSHFNLPDHRGKFKRGWAHGTSNDPDRSSRTAAATGGASGDHVGSVQGWQVQSHSHPLGFGGGGIGYGATTASAADWFTPTSTGATGGNQTNPINSAVMSIIKAIP